MTGAGDIWKKRIVFAVVGVGVAGVLLLASLAIVGAVARSRRAAVEREWAAAGWTVPPVTQPNDAALEIERLAAKLGIDLAERGVAGRPRPTGRDRRRLVAAGDTFFRESRETVDSIAATLERGAPAWGSNPNLAGHQKLHGILLQSASRRSLDGEHESAFRTFDASWRLAATLDADLAARLAMLGIVRRQLQTVRRLEQVPDRWVSEMRDRDFRGEIEEALRTEGWRWLQIDDPVEALSIDAPNYSPRGDSPLRPLARFTGPYLKLCAADLSGAWLRGLKVLESTDSLAELDPSTLTEEIAAEAAGWNRLSPRAQSRMAEAVEVLVELEADRARFVAGSAVSR